MADSTSNRRHVERVRVAVRVRPRNRREETLEASSSAKLLHVVNVDAAAGQIYVCKKKPPRENATDPTGAITDRELRCTYDCVFAPEATQNDVFDYVRDSIQQIAQGFNCTIFAYGQTGTGKTHTMLGTNLEKSLLLPSSASSSGGGGATCGPREAWGVIPRAIESLFDELQSIASNGAAAAIVHCSYMQIYNNDVYDLLQENLTRMKEPLAVRELIKGNGKQIYVSGLSEFRVAGLDETLKLLRQGNKNRTIRATEYNEKSSRSHALLQLSIEVESRGVEGPTTTIRRAKLNLVDLAGSEKWDTDVAMGTDRCKELTSINQSLSALGNVISALANPRRTHVPYRDSKLTRLLQDSLGGNTRTTVIATISQDESAIEETISTLLFADRAKCVTLRVQANEMVDDAVLLAQAQREIARLKLLLKKNASQEQMNDLETKVAKLTRENGVLTSENKRLKQAMAAMQKEKNKEIDKSETSFPATPQDDHAEGIGTPHPPRVGLANGHQPRLRLELEQHATSTKTPKAPTQAPFSVRRGSTYEADRYDQAQAANDQANAKLLEQIQSERRALEQELERIELQQQTPRRQHSNAGASTMPQEEKEDDDLCPMCGCEIDDHSDDQLDACIEQESAAMAALKTNKTIAPSATSSSGNGFGHTITQVRPLSSTSSSRVASRTASEQPVHTRTPRAAPPRTPPPVRKPVTPRSNTGTGDGLAKKPASPYLQEMFVKQPTAGAVVPQRHDPGVSTLKEQRRSVRDLAMERTVSENGDDDSSHHGQQSHKDVRPSTAGTTNNNTIHNIHIHSNSNSNNNTQQPTALFSSIPIVHQGSKSVKALKRFQATSPYNASKAAATTKRTNNATRTSTTSNNNNDTNDSESAAPAAPDDNRVSYSLRDVGLSLLIYKFRYDCWYPCTVVGYDTKRKLHCCQYEYGDKQWQELSQNKVKCVGRGCDSP